MYPNTETTPDKDLQITTLMGVNFTLTNTISQLKEEISALQRQLEWFKKHVFGQKSERRVVVDNISMQFDFGDSHEQASNPPPEKLEVVASHTRRQKKISEDQNNDGLFFDESKLPVEVITESCPEAKGLKSDEYEIISQKISYRLLNIQPAS